MDLLTMYLLKNGGGSGGANYIAILNKLNESFGLSLTKDTPIEEIIAAISDIENFEDVLLNTINDQFGVSLDKNMSIDEMIEIIENIIIFENWSDYIYENWISEEDESQ